MKNNLYIVIPCYNEADVLTETAKRLKEKCEKLIIQDKISKQTKVIFVDDGSTDNTWSMIESYYKNDDLFSGIKLSRNKGHQNALLAGLMFAKDFADMVISMDADLQDDVNAIDMMVDKYLEGYDIVYGVRSKRDKDTLFKKQTAEKFYRIANYIGCELIFNHADFRLMSKRAIEGLSEYKEVNLFLRGIVPMIGFPSTKVLYNRDERYAGESKYTTKKMISFALEGITSLSVKPIRLVTAIGFGVFTISIIMLIYIIVRYFQGATVLGWASVAVSVWSIGGLQLLSIGIVGEYIGKIYLESKERPRFIVEKYLHNIDKKV